MWCLNTDALGLPKAARKNFSVVTLLVTAERERISFFYREGSFCACVPLFPVKGFGEFLHFLKISVFNLIFFFYPLQSVSFMPFETVAK